jgi:hypothetical protein
MPILEQENVTWQIRGEWMRPASKLKGNGFTLIERLINMALLLIFT